MGFTWESKLPLNKAIQASFFLERLQTAVAQGKMKELWNERGLWDAKVLKALRDREVTWDEDEAVTLREVSASRAFANREVKEYTPKNIRDFLKKHSERMAGDEHTWGLQSSFWTAIMGAGGPAALISKAFGMLPSASAGMNASDSVQRLRTLAKSALFALCDADSQHIVKQAVLCVEATSSGSAPPIRKNPTDGLRRVYERLPHFLWDQDEQEETVTGVAAWTVLMGKLADCDKGDQLEIYVNWSWLGTSDDKKRIDAQRAAIQEAWVDAKKKAQSAKDSEKPPAKTPGPKAKAKAGGKSGAGVSSAG